MPEKVFINCPYDSEYKHMFFALIYICEYYGYEPIFASCDESSSDRMETIIKCIVQSRYAIHDISRMDLETPRYNMPFELGMYYMHIKEGHNNKMMLVLEGEQNKSDIVLSDLSGIEIKSHSNELEQLFKPVRDFFYVMNADNKISPTRLYNEYIMGCIAEIDLLAKSNGFDSYTDLEPFEFKDYVKAYLGR